MTNLEMLDFIIRSFEGGYVDHPSDPGAATNHGVTRRTLSRWRGGTATKADVKALTLDEATRILHQGYLVDTHLDWIGDWRLRFALLDFCINSGCVPAIKALQHAIGMKKPDGVLTLNGPTLKAVNAHPDPRMLRDAVIAARLALLGQLITRKGKAVFAEGWLNRVGKVLTV